MNSDDWMDLALRVTEGTATPEDRRRLEAELIERPERREEWLRLRQELQRAREAMADAADLGEHPEEAAVGKGANKEEDLPATAGGRVRWWWAGLAAAGIALGWWLGRPGTGREGVVGAESPRVAYVVPEHGSLIVEQAGERRTVDRPTPLVGGEIIRAPGNQDVLLLTAEGRVRRHPSGEVVVPTGQPPAETVRSWWTTTLATIAARPGMRGGGVIRVHCPRGATRMRSPEIHWSAVTGKTYDVELRDQLLPARAPWRVTGVVPPLSLGALQADPLVENGIYLLVVAESGRPMTAASVRFLVEASAADPGVEAGPSAGLTEAFQAVAASPARTGDAWLRWHQLPAAWRESELGRRLELAIHEP
ncbi:MAG: hypothetical protein HZC55_07665 [Verrucomicrobia bacterium]|nr:hypothetical protein [Verrucomicrobiota bacterium]